MNFDGRISFLEYLLYQYKDVANPADFCQRSMGHDEHPEIKKARLVRWNLQLYFGLMSDRASFHLLSQAGTRGDLLLPL